MTALGNITVLDLTHVLAGPYATMLLADMGARVIKIEPPGRGEATRRLLEHSPEYSRDGMGAYFLTLCRNKKSVALDLKQDEGQRLLHAMVEQADVVVSNFGVGVAERLGIGHDALERINPRIITCTISGFGETGPDARRPSFDLVAQAMGGGMSLTGFPEGDPVRAGIPIGDLGAGLFATIGILGAIEARHATGRGRHIDISMLDCQLSLLSYIGTMFLMSGNETPRSGNAHAIHVPYNSFRTRTRHLIVAVISDGFWHSLVEVIGDDALRQERFATQPGRLAERAFIEERLQEAFLTQSCEHWLELLARHRIPAAPVNDLAGAFADPQALARGMRLSVPLPGGGSVEVPGNPIKFSEGETRGCTAPPRVGEHSVELLREMIGLDSSRIAQMLASGVIGAPGN
ncbi:CoA transferase [Sphingomonas sp. AOB5]|uniref:CaiB/BaiF CoA transferase family protein n=1 Tax=Sphingomonas sp. AOB5 TaxID=3034017 RepID=UPI0023F6BF56|nr:CoA transferase [Sphingomonas sp. AOB5]MDF7775620.1 CoA transferase [Sphingomonas sp. AOB5]